MNLGVGHVFSCPKQPVHARVLSEQSVCPSCWHISLEVTTVFQGHVDVRWQGHEVKPERGLRIVTQPRQARALGLSWLQLALVWVRAGRHGRVSLALRFLNPSPPRCPLRVLSTGFSLEEFPSSVLYVAGTPADCPPHPPRASGPHPSRPSLLTGLAWLLSLCPRH